MKKIEQLINQVLQLDEENFNAITELAGKIIAIDISGLNFIVYLAFSRQGIILDRYCEDPADVTIKAAPTTLLAMVLVEDSSQITSVGNMEIVGDVGLAQQLQSIMRTMEIDWEELFSRWIGDTPAHKLGNILRDARQYMRETRKNLSLDLSEYLRYEKDILPDKEEIDEYNSAVDVIRNDTERLQQRIKRLENKFL